MSGPDYFVMYSKGTHRQSPEPDSIGMKRHHRFMIGVSVSGFFFRDFCSIFSGFRKANGYRLFFRGYLFSATGFKFAFFHFMHGFFNFFSGFF